MRLPKGAYIRCHTSTCPLPMVNLMPLDGDCTLLWWLWWLWRVHCFLAGYEGIVAKLKWNVSIREAPPFKRGALDTPLAADEQL